jgi:hypothetical protein
MSHSNSTSLSLEFYPQASSSGNLIRDRQRRQLFTHLVSPSYAPLYFDTTRRRTASTPKRMGTCPDGHKPDATNFSTFTGPDHVVREHKNLSTHVPRPRWRSVAIFTSHRLPIFFRSSLGAEFPINVRVRSPQAPAPHRQPHLPAPHSQHYTATGYMGRDMDSTRLSIILSWLWRMTLWLYRSSSHHSLTQRC